MKRYTLVVVAVALLAGCGRSQPAAEASCADNPPGPSPWFATITPSEAGGDIGRTHVFGSSCSAVSASQPPVIAATATDLPGLYNIVTRGPDELFALGGSFGITGDDNSPYLAAFDATSLKPRWRTRLPGIGAGDWNYPGAMGVHRNGDLYAVYSHRIARLDPHTGAIKAQTTLPTNQSPQDVAYNGFVVLSDGRIAAKSIHRKPGCTEPDFKAFLNCETEGMAASTLVLVNPETLAVEQSLIAPEHVRFRITDARLDGGEFVYLPGEARIYRYRYAGGRLGFDDTWQATYRQPGQTPGTAVAMLGDWVVIQTNGIPAAAPMSIVAISQRDATRQHRIEPFAGDSAGGSFIPSLPTVDPVQKRIYTFDGFAGRLAALDFYAERGLSIAWKTAQRSFAFSALVGPPSARVLVSTDMTSLLGNWVFPRLGYTTKLKLIRYAKPRTEDLVWRDAASGREIARVPDAVAAGGSVPVPGFGGSFYAPDLHRDALVRLAAQARR